MISVHEEQGQRILEYLKGELGLPANVMGFELHMRLDSLVEVRNLDYYPEERKYYLKTYLGWIVDSVVQEVSRDKSRAQKMTLSLAERVARGLEANGVKGEIVEIERYGEDSNGKTDTSTHNETD